MEEVNFYKPEERRALTVWLFDDTLEVQRDSKLLKVVWWKERILEYLHLTAILY